ncbi:phosphorylase B kinase alpha regulatory chain [Aphelenchoides avenae]|nr:phosphorylase B kinase alpha regulatory chain [Aphelenchus avenae]
MRARTQSGVRLDQLMVVVEKTILKHQDPVTGLFANNQQDFADHAWLRDNLYAAQAVWAMYRAYQKSAEFDEDLAKAHELGLNCIKVMQSLLECMMRQVDKVERFKRNQRSRDSLHAKYSVHTKRPVVGDGDWGHLQIDAVSLYLLVLAQMTASGLQIVRNFDEIAVVQNLVYYIETGYRTPDFGIWERGDKTNQGIRELNASSVGMAKAALQAMNDVGDLFGDGSAGSIIHETDASLLSIISYPAFAVEDHDLVKLTRTTVTDTLLGRYGCRRFLRDGYKTALEDPNRLYYHNAELQKFENIECEWPVFLCYLLLDAKFRKDEEASREYWRQLESVVVPDPNCPKYGFLRLVPELYKVPLEKVELERENHGTQDRVAAGTTPFLWAQSLYIICCLLHDGFLSPAELDPLSRRLSVAEKRPPCEVQVVVLAETEDVQHELAQSDIEVQMLRDIDPVFSVQPASVFAKILQKLGESNKLRLTGRPLDRDVELLSTSKLYHLGQKFVVFTPQFMDRRRSHLMYDIRILMDEWSSELQYIYTSWNSVSISGRPLVVLIISKNMLQPDCSSMTPRLLNRRQKSTVLGALKKIKNGYIGGARVVMKNISEFFRTTSVSKLELRERCIEDYFANESYHLPRSLPQTQVATPAEPSGQPPLKRTDSIKDRWSKQFNAVHKASMRHRSIMLDSNDADLSQLRLAYSRNTSDFDRSHISPIRELKHDDDEKSSRAHLHTSFSMSPLNSNSDSSSRLDRTQMEGMRVEDLIDMLTETTVLDEQASIVHFLWMKIGPNFDTKLNGVVGVTVRVLVEEIYMKACECRDWAWVRLTSGLLKKQMDELAKAITNLLVRQKQITVGMPSKNEEPITSPKNKEDLADVLSRAYANDSSSYTLAQEIIVCLGSLVRTEPRLFVEMFRLRIGLIIQILASELSRLRSLSGDEASQQLLAASPFELKCMLHSLLSGRLLEESTDDEAGGKELRTGMGSFRKQIEERKVYGYWFSTHISCFQSMRKSKSLRTRIETTPPKDASQENGTAKNAASEDTSDSEDLGEDFQFGIWLRHRRIDGALNRVPPDFYANLWDTVRMFPHGLSINGTVLNRSLTQEMTRREIKFALQVEQVLNQISEPEYREAMIEALSLMGHLEKLLMTPPRILQDRSFDVDQIIHRANYLFIEHNKEMGTLVLECCASGNFCSGAHGICQHFYDSAPAGEYGTAHYMIKALIDIFAPVS